MVVTGARLPAVGRGGASATAALIVICFPPTVVVTDPFLLNTGAAFIGAATAGVLAGVAVWACFTAAAIAWAGVTGAAGTVTAGVAVAGAAGAVAAAGTAAGVAAGVAGVFATAPVEDAGGAGWADGLAGVTTGGAAFAAASPPRPASPLP